MRPATAPIPDDAASTDVAVRAKGVRKVYDDVVAVGHLDLEVRRGEFFTLLGPSGSGKTTTLRMIAGFEIPDEGTIELDGEDVTRHPPYQRDVNTVFQDYALFPHMNVAANVGYGLRIKRTPKAELGRRVEEALAMVRLEGLGGRRPVQLSGGQRQRVALARALVNRPSVLLLDEPLGALDLKLRQEMQLELKGIQRELEPGVTFVYVTHDQEEALTMSDRIAVFSTAGRLEQVGPPGEVYERPATEFVAGFVGASNVMERDGRRFTVRPEKIDLREGDDPPAEGRVAERGVVADVVYLGTVTRYLVDLERGDRLVVVRQNLDTTAEEALALRGRRVTLGWRPEHVTPLQRPEEEQSP